jgi:hypothetical protein
MGSTMRLHALIALILVMTSATSVQANPQSAPPQVQEPATADLADIEVVGRSPEQVQSFIRDVAAAPPRRRLARWNRSICVGVSNLERRYAQFMVDRVTLVASDMGLETEAPGCRPNIMIIAASDAEPLARALVADDPSAFRPAQGISDLGADALERFQTTDAPVRWWHVSLPVLIDSGELAVALDGEMPIGPIGPEPLMINVREATRLRANTRDDLDRVVIIIDVAKVGRIGFGALSDYVAMIALAQIAPDPDTTAYDTVLNLFSTGAVRPVGLTRWDRDYLAALYAARPERLRVTQQSRDIMRAMTTDRPRADDGGTSR